MSRVRLEAFGRYGTTVNVFSTVLDGEAVARVEWREAGRRRTQTFRGPKRDREAQAKAFAEGPEERLKGGPLEAPKRYTVGDLWA